MKLESVALLRQLLTQVDIELQQFAESDCTPDEIADALLDMNLIKRDLSIVYTSLEAICAKKMTEDFISLRDGAEIERKSASDRGKWRHKELALDVATRIKQTSIDMDTGEVTMSFEDMIVALLDYVAPSYWRVKALSNLGLNADNYCEVSEPRTSIIVRKGNAE
jgi:hypothetical protein